MFTGGSFKTGVHNRISSTLITDIGINYTTNFNLELHIPYFKTQFEDLKKYDIYTLPLSVERSATIVAMSWSKEGKCQTRATTQLIILNVSFSDRNCSK